MNKKVFLGAVCSIIVIILFFATGSSDALVIKGDCWKKTWAPNEGIANISQRAISNRFIWYSKPFSGTETTYEHETKTNEKNFANYGGYWISSLPTPYLDWGNEFDAEDSFTVGTLSAEKIDGNVWYYTGIALTPQSVYIADFRIGTEKGAHIKGCEFVPYCAGTIIPWSRDRCVAVHFTVPYDVPVHWWK